ncbi:DUF819 family protein [Pelagibaculum spongiae]|uniref:DUF819 domain-containing protein n=1 Tax=Pelagibaculum spongiae TaxID=2080658 RepID=A0A2V1GX82_9GAMM|nr:DUF819 family protein [Pelagibaculum spongiae]PVZ65633.1 hypothetical protein DC094_17250 [Pelagibaculum spongiae]
MSLLVLIPFYFLIPIAAIALCMRSPLVNKLGPVIVCYALGIFLGLGMEQLSLTSEALAAGQEEMLGILVALALPLLLFSTDVRGWFGQAGKAAIAMSFALLSVTLVATLAAIPLIGEVDNLWQVAGMAVGVFTGSTPNVAAIKVATEASSDTFLLVHGYDVITSMMYLLLVMTAAHKVAKLFLPAFAENKDTDEEGDHDEHLEQYKELVMPSRLKNLGLAVLATVAVVGLSVAISKLLPASYSTMAVILLLTLGGVLCALSDKIRNIRNTYHLGMFLIMAFCTVAGSLFTSAIFEQITWQLMAYFLAIVFGSMLLHLLLCKFTNIDADTFLITSVASICSPPFVPVAAAVMNNRKIMLTGLSSGVIGYAAGSVLGIGVALMVKHLGGL